MTTRVRLAAGVLVQASVTTGEDPETGEVVVLIRWGDTTVALTPDTATELADDLQVEAAFARHREEVQP